MYKTLVWFSLSVVMVALGTYVYIRITTQNIVVMTPPVPTVLEEAGKTVEEGEPAQGRILSLSK